MIGTVGELKTEDRRFRRDLRSVNGKDRGLDWPNLRLWFLRTERMLAERSALFQGSSKGLIRGYRNLQKPRRLMSDSSISGQTVRIETLVATGIQLLCMYYDTPLSHYSFERKQDDPHR